MDKEHSSAPWGLTVQELLITEYEDAFVVKVKKKEHLI